MSGAARRRWASDRGAVLLLALGVAAVVHAALGNPGLVRIPGWFYRPSHPGLDVGAGATVSLAGALVLGALAYRLRSRSRVATLALLFGTSLLAQVGFMAMSPEGLATYWTRLSGGHGEFLQVAQQRADAWGTLRRYEALVAADALGHFPPSKPPGALGAYMVVDRLGELLREPLAPLVRSALASPARAHAAGAAVALWLFPLCTALIAPFTCLLGWVLAPARRRPGVVAGLLLAFAPTTLLITHHLDGALYPLIAVGVALAWVAAVQRSAGVGRALLAAMGGGLLMLGVYTTFSLLPAGLLAALLTFGVWWRRRARGQADGGDVLGIVAAAGAGFVVALSALVLALDFEPLARFRNAMAHHEEWKAGVPTGLWRLVAPLEFFTWAGWTLVLVFLVAALGAVRREPGRKGWVAALVLAVLLLGSALAGTNEVARLWAFQLPFIAVGVGLAFRWRAVPLAAICVAQLATAVALFAVGPW